MTLIGTWVELDRAWIWADTEFYWRSDEERADKRHLAGRPLGHQLKIEINERSRIAAAGAGDAGGNERIAEACAHADLFDHLMDGCPAFLEGYARNRVEYFGERPGWICVTAGWSRRFGRMMGAVLQDRSRYLPIYTPRFSSPELDEFGTLNPNEAADILSYAQAQMRRVKEWYPLAGAGWVTVAEVRRDRVAVTSFDLVTGKSSPSLPAFPAMRETMNFAVEITA